MNDSDARAILALRSGFLRGILEGDFSEGAEHFGDDQEDFVHSLVVSASGSEGHSGGHHASNRERAAHASSTRHAQHAEPGFLEEHEEEDDKEHHRRRDNHHRHRHHQQQQQSLDAGPKREPEVTATDADIAASPILRDILAIGSGNNLAGTGAANENTPQDDSMLLSTIVDDLEELEIEANSFAAPSSVRSDVLSLFVRIVETVVILLAVQHSINLARTTDDMYVAPLLILLVYFNSQIKYLITHLTRKVALLRRRMAKTEREEIIERQKSAYDTATPRKKGGAASTAPKLSPSEGGGGGGGGRDYVLFRDGNEKPGDNKQRQQQRQQASVQRRDRFPAQSVYTLAQVRLSSLEMAFSFITNMLYLVNVFITFLLVKTIMDRINSSFSDGMWIMVKGLPFITLVVPIYVEFQVSGYRQELVARSHRFGS